jgi:hypothetical protein
MTEDQSREWSLTEAAKALDVPQHRLIYLCEKGVIQPDLKDAEGRGSSRLFSSRNLLEFAVALRLRDLELPVGVVGGILFVLRAFERSVASEIPDFRLPHSLAGPRSPDLRVLISDGRRLFFLLRTGKKAPKLFGGIDLKDLEGSASVKPVGRSLGPADPLKGSREDFGIPEGSRHTRVEISVTRIAQDLGLPA